MPPHKPQRRACRGRRKLGLLHLRGKLNTTNRIHRCCAHLLRESKDLAENAETFIGKIETLRMWSRQTTEQRALRKHVVLREIIGTLRTEKGTSIHEKIMVVLATWVQEGFNSFQMLRMRLFHLAVLSLRESFQIICNPIYLLFKSLAGHQISSWIWNFNAIGVKLFLYLAQKFPCHLKCCGLILCP